MWSDTFIVRLNCSLLSLPMLAVRKFSWYPNKNWKILFSCFPLCLFSIPNEKSLEPDLWVRQTAHQHLRECNYFTLFHHSCFKPQWFYGAFFENCVYSLFQVTCANLCENVEQCGAVAVDEIANKTKFAKTVSCRWTVIVLKNLVVFFWRSLELRRNFLLA